jgi:predicted GIY-YIG superfamily endonuclease
MNGFTDVTVLARRWTDRLRYRVEHPASYGTAHTRRSEIPSGRAAAFRRGVAHEVAEAVIVTDGTTERLVARWVCGGGSIQPTPVDRDGPQPVCDRCLEVLRMPAPAPVVYRAYDRNCRLLYVGCTKNLASRLRAHTARTGSGWWSEVSCVSVEEFPTYDDAWLAESRAIADEAPLYNQVGMKPHVVSPAPAASP